MRNLLLVLAVLAMAGPAMARDFVPWEGTPTGVSNSRSDLVLEYDGELWYGYGVSPNWTDYTVVNFETPAGGPYTLVEAQYYVFGPGDMLAEIWSIDALSSPPVGVSHTGETFMPVAGAWPPGAWSIGDVSAYGISLNSGDLFGIGTDYAFYAGTSGVGLADAFGDGNPGHSWVMYAGAWEDDTYVWDTDDGHRAGLNVGPTPADQTTWGGVKSLYR